MKKSIFPVILFFLLLSSCGERDQPLLITKKIQYDVNIKSPNPEYDWWIQNLVGPQREEIVTLILDGAKTGKFKAYDYYYQPISKQEVASILSDTLIQKLRRTEPPYALYDTMVIHKITGKDVVRLRFMEEWRVNPKTLQFEKIIKGVAPVAKRIDAKGVIRWQPLFWIFPNKNTAQSLQNEEQ